MVPSNAHGGVGCLFTTVSKPALSCHHSKITDQFIIPLFHHLLLWINHAAILSWASLLCKQPCITRLWQFHPVGWLCIWWHIFRRHCLSWYKQKQSHASNRQLVPNTGKHTKSIPCMSMPCKWCMLFIYKSTPPIGLSSIINTTNWPKLFCKTRSHWLLSLEHFCPAILVPNLFLSMCTKDTQYMSGVHDLSCEHLVSQAWNPFLLINVHALPYEPHCPLPM